MNYLGVFGHVVLDYIFQVPRLPEPNTSIQVSGSHKQFGGTAGNIARTAARLGVKTSLASFVGDDFPEEYRAALAEEGIDLTDLRVTRGSQTPTAWIFSDPAGNQFAIIDQGPMGEGSEKELLEHTIRESEVVHIATGRPEYYSKVAGLAKKLGKRVAFDPSQEIHYVYTAETFREILGMSDFFFCNLRELQRALSFIGGGIGELQREVGVIVLTLGTEGSVVYTEDATWKVPAISPDTLVDPTGAGDAYRGGFYAGLRRGLDPPTSGLVGAAVASFSIEGQGPQGKLPTWEEAWDRASRHGKEIRKETP